MTSELVSRAVSMVNRCAARWVPSLTGDSESAVTRRRVVALTGTVGATIAVAVLLLRCKRTSATRTARGGANDEDDEEPFKPLTVGEKFEIAFAAVDAKAKRIVIEVDAAAFDKQAMQAEHRSGDFSAAWRQVAGKTILELEERITKAMIEVDQLPIPPLPALPDPDTEEQERLGGAPTCSVRLRRKDLIRRLHAVSVKLESLK